MENFETHLKERSASWEACNSKDEQVNAIVETLFTDIKMLNDTLEQAKSALREQSALTLTYRYELERVKEGFNECLARPEPDPYVKILVDGNHLLFKDHFIKGGFVGGRNAVRSLVAAVEQLMDSPAERGDGPRPKVEVRVCANLKGLSKLYKEAGVADLTPERVEWFVAGFKGAGWPSCVFLDADEMLDPALIGERFAAELVFTLDQHRHCRRVFFGGVIGADGCMRRHLGECARTPEWERRRIALVRGPPVAPWLAALPEDSFRVVALDDVFR
ncbi:hypothetical protein RB598_008944 [Gaeumannomyces tritici]